VTRNLRDFVPVPATVSVGLVLAITSQRITGDGHIIIIIVSWSCHKNRVSGKPNIHPSSFSPTNDLLTLVV
jgi:hypothetical protein